MTLRGSPESAGNVLRRPTPTSASLRTSLTPFALRSYILPPPQLPQQKRQQHNLPSMTTTPPTHRLWHPTRGIAFSPSLLSPTSPVQLPRPLGEASYTTSREQPVKVRRYPTGQFTTPIGIATPTYIGTDYKIAPDAQSDDAATTIAPTKEEEELDERTKDPPVGAMDFKIVPDLFYAAKKAPAGSPESFWSYTQYRGSAEDGTPQRVKVHYCRTQHTMERVCQQYFMDEEVLGFDLEWVAESSKFHGLKRNISLIQLASPSRIALFHLALFPNSDDMIGPSFRTIMEDAGITKVGVAIKGDTTRLRNWLDVHSRGLMELSHLYKLVTYSPKREYKNINRRLVPLATQVREYLHLPMFKGQDVRSSDWTKGLSMDQIIYSASDAYAGLHLYATLEHHRKQLEPCPPIPYHAEHNRPIRLAPDAELATNDEPTEATEDAPVPGRSATTSEVFAASVLESIKIEDVDNSTTTTTTAAAATSTTVTETNDSTTITETATTVAVSSTAAPTRAKQRPRLVSMREKDSRVEVAEDRAATFRSTRPRTRASFAELRAYYLWHCYDLKPEDICPLLRAPPLKETTVVKYILSAVKAEHFPVDTDRLRAELADHFPPAILKLRYAPVVNYLSTGKWDEPTTGAGEGEGEGEEGLVVDFGVVKGDQLEEGVEGRKEKQT